MNTSRALRALANDRRLQILNWLKDPTKHFPPQVDGDLVKDGVCGVLLAPLPGNPVVVTWRLRDHQETDGFAGVTPNGTVGLTNLSSLMGTFCCMCSISTVKRPLGRAMVQRNGVFTPPWSR